MLLFMAILTSATQPEVQDEFSYFSVQPAIFLGGAIAKIDAIMAPITNIIAVRSLEYTDISGLSRS